MTSASILDLESTPETIFDAPASPTSVKQGRSSCMNGSSHGPVPTWIRSHPGHFRMNGVEAVSRTLRRRFSFATRRRSPHVPIQERRNAATTNRRERMAAPFFEKSEFFDATGARTLVSVGGSV
ncbi:MAG: hypothetical protein CMJ27_14620 [Phycisphaerae bacterium]|nr:hypothetical protein [Phycisphaerae bacterium]OUW99661.1 MAG: hypothetical protein CBD91_08525 [Phycisphaeraceae bacterium TMED231]